MKGKEIKAKIKIRAEIIKKFTLYPILSVNKPNIGKRKEPVI